MKHVIRRIKHVLKYLLQFFLLKIRGGPLRGKKWIAATGSKFIKGNYESFKTTPYLQYIHKGDIVYDVGAHVGYYTAIASEIVGIKGKVFAFEPRPLNIAYLKRHIRINNLSNVKLYKACVGEKAGQSKFETRTGTGTGHISEKGNLTVKMVCLDEMYDQGKIPKPDFLKIDVEGGEIVVLQGVKKIIKNFHPIIMVATHDENTHEFVTKFLVTNNYEYRVLNKEGESGDTEILALPIT